MPSPAPPRMKKVSSLESSTSRILNPCFHGIFYVTSRPTTTLLGDNPTADRSAPLASIVSTHLPGALDELYVLSRQASPMPLSLQFKASAKACAWLKGGRMFERRTIITLIILFVIYLGVVYTGRQRKVRLKLLQPATSASHQVPVTNHGNLLTAQPVPARTNIQDWLN
jgi:hypothetical protein